MGVVTKKGGFSGAAAERLTRDSRRRDDASVAARSTAPCGGCAAVACSSAERPRGERPPTQAVVWTQLTAARVRRRLACTMKATALLRIRLRESLRQAASTRPSVELKSRLRQTSKSFPRQRQSHGPKPPSRSVR
eukprot:4186895-Prymnesium_polylepis.1